MADVVYKVKAHSGKKALAQLRESGNITIIHLINDMTILYIWYDIFPMAIALRGSY